MENFKDYNELPYSENIINELFKRHIHAGQVEDEDLIVYYEKDVLFLMELLKSEIKNNK